MRKEVMLKARVGMFHRQRVQELSQQTGLTGSEVVRRLIENAAVVMRPTLGATITVEKSKSASVFQDTGAFVGINQ